MTTDRAPTADRPIAAEPAPRFERPAIAPPPSPPEALAPPIDPIPEMEPQMAAPIARPLAPIRARTSRPIASPAPVASSAPMRGDGEDGQVERGATAPQLRRFIKSRAYVPMHELRRRFAINGGDDDVTVVDVDRQRVYVGLPEREGRLLGELLRGGDIGYELSLDPISPIVVGVYPMRPVTRA
jgi:hypothetical protein